jgi:Fe-S-cluster-containing hydrogenase component 2
MRCLRACPTQAIRIRGGAATLLEDRCIDCGECVRVCPNHAFLPRTSSPGDISGFRHTIAFPSPVFYSQFGKDVSPAMILSALKTCGFDDACDVTAASEAVNFAIQEYLDSTPGPRPLISPFCPAIVRLVQVRYPNLLDHLIPLESPMEIAAREAKRSAMKTLGLQEHEIGAIYLTPCPAKMVALKDPPRKRDSHLDGAVPIAQIYPHVVHALARAEHSNGAGEVSGLGLGWPILGGQVASLRAEERIAIAGLPDVMRVFDEIENGKLRDIQYIECHSCPTACVGGALTVENPYIARGRVLRLLEQFGRRPAQDPDRLRALYHEDYFALRGSIAPSPVQPLDNDIARAIQKMHRRNRLFETLPGIDCGACGAPTCMAFAADVIRGEADPETCVFLAMHTVELRSRHLLSLIQKHRNNLHTTMTRTPS